MFLNPDKQKRLEPQTIFQFLPFINSFFKIEEHIDRMKGESLETSPENSPTLRPLSS